MGIGLSSKTVSVSRLPGNTTFYIVVFWCAYWSQ